MTGERQFFAGNRWKVMLAVCFAAFVGALGTSVFANSRLAGYATINCREVETIKAQLRRDAASTPELLDQLDLELSAHDRVLLLREAARERRLFRAQPCPRASD